MPSPAGPAKILPLTTARFFAALYVVLYHLALSNSTSHDQPWLNHNALLTRFASLGYVSVPFFFFLSGFVLALAYCHQRSAFSARSFFLARFARIYPSLTACLFIDLAYVLSLPRYFQGYSPKHIFWILFTSFAALEAWFQQPLALDPPTWTISAEVFFYILFPVLGTLFWRLRPRALVILSVTLYSLSNLTLLYLIHHHAGLWTLYINPIHHLPEFVLGICLAKFSISFQPQRWTAYAPAALLAALAAFLLIPTLDLQIPAPLLQHALLAPLFAVAVLALCSGNKILTTLFSTPTLVLLGEASFTLYLIHFPLLHIFHPLIAAHALLGTTLCLATAITYSIASFLYLETPARRLILRITSTTSRESTVTASLAQ